MQELFYNIKNNTANNDTLLPQGIQLLAKHADMEIMTQNIVKGATVWLTPAESPDTFEFFFVQKGSILLKDKDEEKTLTTGDSFYVCNLSENIPCKVLEDTILLYVSDSPMFDDAHDFEEHINNLITQINDKDHYTFKHSANVMVYSTKLYTRLNSTDEKSDAVLNDMIVAALFHDVGKCYTPDEVLQKKGKLTPDEWRSIQLHPMDSARLLRKHYGKRVAEIAAHHHERLDGSGYPYGLTGDKISAEAKIVAVADAFDAMTTNRGYNRVKSFEEAAQELYDLPHHFDRKVTEALLELVRDNDLNVKEAY